MKIATWNVNSLKVRLPHVEEWLEQHSVDVLGLQETKTVDDKFPDEALTAAGYHSCFTGQPTYNGVALLSREPAADVLTDPAGVDTEQRRIIAATYGDVRVVNLYVVNGKEVGSDKYDYKLDWLKRVTAWLAEERQRHERMVVMGDFNIAPEDADVHDPEAWHERILCSTPERQALAAITGLGFTDCFRLFEQAEGSFSWWDYRQAGFRRNRGLRIDLILATEALSQQCRQCVIDKEPRAWDRPSDHAPVLAEFAA
ncbi:MAG: exodeoxyribonuclease III [Wenzhouxiangellaceae bacterium]